MNWIRMVLVIVALSALAGVITSIYRGGKGARQNEIDQQNIRAAEAAGEARMSWRDCRDAGGVYDFDTGECPGASPGDGQ